MRDLVQSVESVSLLTNFPKTDKKIVFAADNIVGKIQVVNPFPPADAFAADDF